MEDKHRLIGGQQDLSLVGGGEAPDVVSGLKRDLEGWREVLLPISSFLRWDQPYYPAMLFGMTSTLFLIIWYSEVSTLTAVSLFCLLLGVADFVIPYIGPKVSGYQSWTVTEESEFHMICESIANMKQDIIHVWTGFSAMRKDNSKVFFFIVMGFLLFTAWLGNLVDNLFLTYLLVSFILALPGMQRNAMTRSYMLRVSRVVSRIMSLATGAKSKAE